MPLEVVPLGLDPAPYQQALPRLLPGPYVLALGGLRASRRPELLAQAILKAGDRLAHLKLVIAGPDRVLDLVTGHVVDEGRGDDGEPLVLPKELQGDVADGVPQGAVVKKALDAKQTPEQIMEDLYIRAFSRKPTPREMELIKKDLDADPNKQQTLEDLFWALLNTKEFVFNH